jgi:hypothetical protein
VVDFTEYFLFPADRFTSHNEESLISLIHSKVGAGNSGGNRASLMGYIIDIPEGASFFPTRKNATMPATTNNDTDIIIFNLLINLV